MPSIKMVQNDTAPTLTINVKRAGTVVDLTGSTVKFKIKNTTSGSRTNDAANTCTLTSPTAGVCTYTFNTGDIPSAATYEADVEITYASGKVETPFEPVTISVRAEA